MLLYFGVAKEYALTVHCAVLSSVRRKVISQIHNIYLYVTAICFGHFNVAVIRLYTRTVKRKLFHIIMYLVVYD